MTPSPFESDAAIGSLRPIIRRDPDNASDVEMVKAAWGLKPLDKGGKPFRFIRSEGRTFPERRCLVPASDFTVTNNRQRFRVSLDDGNFFYLAGIWQPAACDWPVSHAVITIEANQDIWKYHDRQGVVLLRRQVMAWLDLTETEAELLQPLPARSYIIEPLPVEQSPKIDRRQPALPL